MVISEPLHDGWVSCRNAADKEALDGRITYYPASRAIPISYFPYLVRSEIFSELSCVQSWKTNFRERGELTSQSAPARQMWASTLHW